MLDGFKQIFLIYLWEFETINLFSTCILLDSFDSKHLNSFPIAIFYIGYNWAVVTGAVVH